MVLLFSHISDWVPKGQLISKCLFGVFKFFQKTNGNKSTWGILVVKSNCFVCFLEELRIPKSPFEINWPLADVIIFEQNWTISPIVKYQAPQKIINIAQDLRINKRMNDKCVWPFCCCWKSLLFFSIFHGTFAKFTRKKFSNSTTSSKDEHS